MPTKFSWSIWKQKKKLIMGKMNLGLALKRKRELDRVDTRRKIRFRRHSYFYFFKRMDLEIRRLKYKDLLCD